MKCQVCNNNIETTRSLTFNNALHLYFDIIAKQFNEMGWVCSEIDFFSGKIIESFWTMELVKEKIWKKLQIELFNKKSTTKITYSEANLIIEVLNKHFAENDIKIEFPCIESYLNKLEIEK